MWTTHFTLSNRFVVKYINKKKVQCIEILMSSQMKRQCPISKGPKKSEIRERTLSHFETLQLYHFHLQTRLSIYTFHTKVFFILISMNHHSQRIWTQILPSFSMGCSFFQGKDQKPFNFWTFITISEAWNSESSWRNSEKKMK